MRKWFELPPLLSGYKRRLPLVLINGLAEQLESWFSNRVYLSRHFDVKVPEILVYDGDVLHDWIDSGGEVTIEYLSERLAVYLDQYVQRPPYHLVGSSLGSQVALAYATAHPKKVSKLVLICPSGLHGDENLPMIEGIRRSNYDAVVKAAFYRDQFATDDLVRAYERKFRDRRWKKGVVRTLRGTVGHSVSELLPLVQQPTLVIWGANDRVLSDVRGAIQAADQILRVIQVVIPKCGHAPQIEKASLVNRLIASFLQDKLTTIPPALDPNRFLFQPTEPPKRHASLLAVPGRFFD
jgi:pimeloyl-ACP methyl ester carboxylesterase